MIVAAMFVVGVVVSVVVMVLVSMAGMFMMVMSMTAAGIGAAFRIERRVDRSHARTQSAHHILDDMIAADSKPLAGDLRRQMAVAEMPGDPHHMLRIAGANFGQRLGRGDDLDETAIFQHQRVAAAQRHRLFQIKQELQAVRPGHRHAAPVTVVETKHDRVGRTGRPVRTGVNVRGARQCC